MRVESGSSFIQMLQAQRAFVPNTKPSEEPELSDMLGELANTPEAAPMREENLASAAGLPLDEIKSIASRAGYVGLNDSDIQRAYVYGESLMTDYRV